MSLTKLKAILAEFDKSNVNELEYEDDDLRVTLRKKSSIHHGVSSNDDGDDEHAILSPLVGIYHDASPAVRVGEKVLAGCTLCIVESMKVMNKICAPADLIVNKINFRDDEKVEYNSKLIEVTFL